MNLLDLLIEARATRDDGPAATEAMSALFASHPDINLDDLINDALTRTEAIGAISDENRTDADADALECMVDVINQIRFRQTQMAEARAERSRRMSEALAKARSANKKDDGDGKGDDGDGYGEDGEGGDDSGEEDKKKAAKTKSSNSVENSGEGEGAGAQPAKVTAAVVPVQRAPLGAMRSDRPRARGLMNRARPSGGSYSIEAASEMPGIAAGQDLGNLRGLSQVVHRRVQGLERAGAGHADIATIRRHVPEQYYAQKGGDEETVSLEQLASIRDEREQALVAAGGWCAPSEVLYDLCDVATMDGLLDHPTLVVRRGGLRWPQTPDFGSIYTAVGFNQSEAQAAAGTVKPCYDVPCPGFSEARLNAIGICLRAGILTAQAYPELVEYFVQQALVAHAHQVNAFKLAQMQSIATAVHFQPTGTAPGAEAYGPGAFASILGALELQVEDLRYRYRWGLDEVLECVAPAWAEPLIRSDLAKRMGVDFTNVTDEMIVNYFRVRSMNVQLVRDWQDALTNSGTGLGASTPALTYPGTVGFLLYHPDTYLIGQADVIDLSAIYDSTNITTNTFTRLFSEEGVLVGKRCFDARFVQVDTCPSGLTGGFIQPTGFATLACPSA